MSLLLYDADCGFCTQSANWARRLPLTVEIRPMQRTDLAELGVDPTRAEREIPFVGEWGEVRYGAAAFAGALSTGTWPWRVAGALLGHPPLSWLARPIYALVAANRHKLPSGTQNCQLP